MAIVSNREQTRAADRSSREARVEAAGSVYAPTKGTKDADLSSLAPPLLIEKPVSSEWHEHAPFAARLAEVELRLSNLQMRFEKLRAEHDAAGDVRQKGAEKQIRALTERLAAIEARLARVGRRADIGTVWKRFTLKRILRADARLLSRSGLFDEDWYKIQYPDAIADGTSPITHFLEEGYLRGCQPNPLFDPRWYLERYADVRQSGQNPLIHFLKYGFREGRDPGPNFQTEFYLAANPDVREAGGNPLGHYLTLGRHENRRPTSRELNGEPPKDSANAQLLSRCGLFDEDWYKIQYPDAVSDGTLPIMHFLEEGYLSGCQPNPLFEPLWYLEQYEDVRQSGQNPVIHYLERGFREGRDPGPNFQTEFYLATYPDIRAAGVNPLSHYLTLGRRENRHPTLAAQKLNELLREPELAVKSEQETTLDRHRETISVISRLLERAPFDKGRDTILLVTHEASRSGAPILAWNIAKRLRERHNIVTLILDGGELASAFEECSVAVIGPVGQVGPDAAQAFVEIILAHCSIAYALVNTIQSRLYVEPLARSFIPVVSLVHEFASYFPQDARNALHWSTQIIFPTKMTVDAAKSRFPDISRQRIHVLPQGRCDLPSYVGDTTTATATAEHLREAVRPRKWRESLIVLGAGSVELRKGVDLFLSCAAAVATMNLQRSVRFVWIGHGYDPINDRNYGSYLAEQITRSGLADKVAILDAVGDLEPAYAVADVFFLSSRLDPLPNVTIDAAFHGLPIVCFEQASGTAELFASVPSLRSCVIPYLDVRAAAAAVARLANDETARKLLGAAARSIAEATFDLDRYVTAVDKVGHEAVAVMRQQQEDFSTIRDDSLFDHRMHGSELLTREHGIRLFLADWLAKGDGEAVLRRPTPGFHPRAYAQERSSLYDVAAVNPLAHFIRSNRPSGPWKHQVITPLTRVHLAESCDGPRVALHAHFYYPQLARDFFKKLGANRSTVDLLLTTDTEAKAAALRQVSAKYDRGEVVIRVVPNRGRDVGPMLTALAEEILQRYDIIGHLHGKRSAWTSGEIGDQWREFLWQNLIGDLHPMMDIIIDHFVAKPDLGLVFPSDPTVCGWDTNRELAAKIAARCGIVQPLPTQIDFPVGMMFWCRVDALRPLIALRLQWEDYPEEPVAHDGTILHALERLLPLVARQVGYQFSVTHVPGTTR